MTLDCYNIYKLITLKIFRLWLVQNYIIYIEFINQIKNSKLIERYRYIYITWNSIFCGILSFFLSLSFSFYRYSLSTITIWNPKYNLLTNFSTLITILAIVCKDTMFADFSALAFYCENVRNKMKLAPGFDSEAEPSPLYLIRWYREYVEMGIRTVEDSRTCAILSEW